MEDSLQNVSDGRLQFWSETMDKYIEPIPEDLEAPLQTQLIGDFIDMLDIKPEKKRKRCRIGMIKYLKEINEHYPDDVVTCYGLVVLANIVKPEFKEILHREAEALFHELMTEVDVPQEELKDDCHAEMEIDHIDQQNSIFSFCGLSVDILNTILLPEYRELVLTEVHTLFQRVCSDLFKPPVEEQNNIEKKKNVRIPNWHKEILRKNYLSIMENVRVEAIMDHLYHGKVIEWNDMDVIKTKLKSEGNREALRHLMDILHKSSHTILPSFIGCLNQTGYDDVADCLQNDMGSMKVNDEEG